MQFLKIFYIIFLMSLLIPSWIKLRRAMIPLGETSVLLLRLRMKATQVSAMLIEERDLLNSSPPFASSERDFRLSFSRKTNG